MSKQPPTAAATAASDHPATDHERRPAAQEPPADTAAGSDHPPEAPQRTADRDLQPHRAVPQETRVAAIVPAAGAGQRLGADRPKALVELAGAPLLGHAIAALLADPRIGLVVIAAPAGLEATVATAAGAVAGTVPIKVVTGGDTRVESVARSLAEVPPETDFVLVHDAARALVPVGVVAAVIEALVAGASAVVPGLPVTDTIRELSVDGSSVTLDRSSLRAVQTPQGFKCTVLRAAHSRRAGPTATDDAGMVEAIGIPVTIVAGHPEAMKVTTAIDLVVAEQILAARSGPTRQAMTATEGPEVSQS